MEKHTASPEMHKFFMNLLETKKSLYELIDEYQSFFLDNHMMIFKNRLQEIYFKLDDCIKSTEEKK